MTQPVSDDLTVMQNGYPVGELERNVHVVLDHEQGDGGIELFNQGGHHV